MTNENLKEELFYFPIGNYYLVLTCIGETLIHKMPTWFCFSDNPIGEYLGKIEIVITKEEYSDFPIEPKVYWNENQCHYMGKGCKGIISEADSAILRINSKISKQYVELFFRVVTAIRIFNQGGLLVHAAGLKKDNKGYLFTGHSGAGKTTLCRLSNDSTILNDDMVILSLINDSWQIGATPFTNPTQVRPNSGIAPLQKIFHLNQAKQHRIEDVTKTQALADLITHVPVISQSSNHLKPLVDRCNNIVKKVQVYNLFFLPDDGFWDLLSSID